MFKYIRNLTGALNLELASTNVVVAVEFRACKHRGVCIRMYVRTIDYLLLAINAGADISRIGDQDIVARQLVHGAVA